MSEKSRILVIEDTANIREIVRDYLTAANYEVRCADDGLDGLRLFQTWQPDLVILDINLPRMSGLEIAGFIRDESNAFIIMLTARAQEEDEIIGLRMGADEYVTKPFSPRTLVARVGALMRRKQRDENKSDPDLLRFEQVTIDLTAHEAQTPAGKLALTFTEFNLLYELARHRGQVLGRDQLLRRVWGDNFAGNDRVVDVYVGQVRRKLEKATGLNLIETVRGVGYKFVDKAT